MTEVYALLTGIDRYQAVTPLRGCVNDVNAVEGHLAGTGAHVLVLRDGEATRAAVIGAFRGHLAAAGPGDAVLFWFSGHGSDAEAPDWAAGLEPGGRVQTLVCADSRRDGVPDLWDKELAVLLDEVAARGPDVTVVLDSCHSDGASRWSRAADPGARARAARTVRAAPARDRASFLPGTIERAADVPPMGWIEMAACHSTEVAEEMLLDGVRHGVFTWSLLRALRRHGRAVTHRELLHAARGDVARFAAQSPQARPRDSAALDRSFLGGATRPAVSAIGMRYTREGWAIDAGAVHGVPAGAGARVGVHGGVGDQQARIVAVRPELSLVEPLSPWSPDRGDQFRVIMSSVPLPATPVAGLRSEAITGSRLLRPVSPDGTEEPALRVAERAGRLTITGRDGVELAEASSVPEAVRALEHIARWRRTWELANDVSPLNTAVGVEITDPVTGRMLEPGDDGEYVVRYTRGPRGWEPPRVRIRLRNRCGTPLWCVLLDLTGGFRVHSDLFPGDFVAPGVTASCLDGRRIRVSLPDGVPAVPGAAGRDRLKLVVAERQFSAAPLHQEALGGPWVPQRGDEVLPAGADWATAEQVLRVEVPYF